MCEVDNVVRIATAVVEEAVVFTELTHSILLSCKKLQTLPVGKHQSIFVNFQDFYFIMGLMLHLNIMCATSVNFIQFLKESCMKTVI